MCFLPRKRLVQALQDFIRRIPWIRIFVQFSLNLFYGIHCTLYPFGIEPFRFIFGDAILAIISLTLNIPPMQNRYNFHIHERDILYPKLNHSIIILYCHIRSYLVIQQIFPHSFSSFRRTSYMTWQTCIFLFQILTR